MGLQDTTEYEDYPEKNIPEHPEDENPESDQDEEEKGEHEPQFLNHKSDWEIGMHIDCLDTYNRWLNAEIIAIRGDYIRVHYSGWNQKFDEWISKQSDRIQKQWEYGEEFKLNNRLDVLDERDNWLEARVIDLNQKQIFVHFTGFKSKYDAWYDKDSDHISEVGSKSKAYGGAKYRKHQNQELQDATPMNPHRKQILEKIKQDEENFKYKLFQKNMAIRETGADGNCLFRAFSDQLYGTEKHYKTIRRVCLDYMEFEKDFYKNYVIGGENGFNDYLERKRKDGCWGDDLEIQAISEIYGTPVEIYAYSNEPMRTFHEVSEGQKEPCRLSYHGKSHYNSIKIIGREESKLIDSDFGQIETAALRGANERAKKRAEQKEKGEIISEEEQKTDTNMIQQMIDLSRQEFENKGKRDMDLALEESLQDYQEAHTVEQDMEKAIQESKREFESKQDEEDLLKMAINESKKEGGIVEDEEAIMKQVMEQSKKEATSTYPAAVQDALNMGFPLEAVLAAYSVVGNDADLIVNYIYENFY